MLKTKIGYKMNKQRRKKIEKLIDELDSIYRDLDEINDEEQSSFDNLPESFQEGEKCQRMEEIINTIDEVKQSIEDSIGQLQEILEN